MDKRIEHAMGVLFRLAKGLIASFEAADNPIPEAQAVSDHSG